MSAAAGQRHKSVWWCQQASCVGGDRVQICKSHSSPLEVKHAKKDRESPQHFILVVLSWGHPVGTGLAREQLTSCFRKESRVEKVWARQPCDVRFAFAEDFEVTSVLIFNFSSICLQLRAL